MPAGRVGIFGPEKLHTSDPAEPGAPALTREALLVTPAGSQQSSSPVESLPRWAGRALRRMAASDAIPGCVLPLLRLALATPGCAAEHQEDARALMAAVRLGEQRPTVMA